MSNPYEGINFVEKKAELKDKDGKVIFEKMVTFPDYFSDTSINIVSSKYFKQDDTDIRTMFNRVSDTIADWGKKDGYFETDEQYQSFKDGLKEHQIHQRFAFNSPVYFNVGYEDEPQASACFILSVDDSMDSITDLAKNESIIFKKGSGAGSNLSNIRGSKEKVGSTGTASGPVSFLKAHDCQASIIKSGGSLRRSAKLSCLDVDHPDIIKFINCKDKEEEKMRILMESGVIIPDDGYEMSDEVFLQNTNLSVRLTQTFIDAVKRNDDWHLINRTDGKVSETFKAKDILMLIAEHAWKTGDPGVQYHDNINDMNPVPSQGDIDASNPCSEYMFLPDTSCNLASYNLMSFFNEKCQFDDVLFTDVVSIMIIAMDIIVDNASYPIESVEKNTKKYRALGLGYTNLGALLMSMGIAYDSDDGREFASLITSISTGLGYTISQNLSSLLGTSKWWNQTTKKTMYKVLNQHHKSLLEVQSSRFSYLKDISVDLWDDVINGDSIRNAQISLLAPTGTISFLMGADTTGIEPDFSLVKYKRLSGSGGSSIKTVNGSVKKSLRSMNYKTEVIDLIIKEIVSGIPPEKSKYLSKEDVDVFDTAMSPENGSRYISYNGHIKMMAAVQPFLSGAISKCVVGGTIINSEHGMMPINSFYNGGDEDSYSDLKLRVDSINGEQETDVFYYGGKRETIKLTLSDGRSIEGTPVHRIKSVYDNDFDWSYLDDIKIDDYVGISIGGDYWSQKDVNITFTPPPLYGSQKKITIPDMIDADLAWFIGAYISEGNITKSNWTLRITNDNDKVLTKCMRIIKDKFGIEGKITLDKRNYVGGFIVSSKSLVLLMEWLGCGGNAETKDIPWCILQSTRDVIKYFINGLYLDGFVPVNQSKIGITLKSNKIITTLQLVMNNLGIRCNKLKTYNKEYDTWYHSLYIHGRDMILFDVLFDFDDDWKTESLNNHLLSIDEYNPVWSDVIPYGRDMICDKIREHKLTQKYKTIFDKRTKNISRLKVNEIRNEIGLPMFDDVYDFGIHFVKVVSIEYDINDVYDFHIPSNHTFIGNGIINHNTVNFPNDATVDEIYNLYLRASDIGLKSVAVYRDGSKNQQVLTNTDKVKVKNIDVFNQRKYLPDNRSGNTHKFIINGNVKGYITANTYDDGKLGEVFCNIAKNGSTLNGLIDSLFTLTSISLQYGVPLEVISKKLIGSKFEPAGFTKNPDIRTTSSLVDYFYRFLALNHLNEEQLIEIGLKLPNGEEKPISNSGINLSTGPCPECGALMRKLGSCEFCDECGHNGGACS